MPSGKVIARQELTKTVVSFQHILVATDFSQEARSALDYALAIARSFQSQVHLVHAIPTGLLQYVAPEGAEDVIRQARQFAGQEMQRLVNDAGCSGKVQEIILFGAAVWPLLGEFIREHSIDLLVVGTHGRTGTKRQLLGPVAEEAFRLAACPVLTVGTPRQQPAPQRNFRNVLLATNFKPQAEYAAQFAYALERELKSHMDVLHVVEDQRDLSVGGRDIVCEFMVTRMRKGMPLSCVGRCGPSFHVRFGDAGEQVVKFAGEEQSDLIVLGMRSGKDVPGMLPSAIAYKVACQAECPVLTIRR
jgi:nucleotide-binding universal stress UspA family protein